MKLPGYNNKNSHRSNGAICILLCVLLAVAVIVPSEHPAAAAASNGKYEREGTVIVSLGDSYSSGEGIEKFYGQDKPYDEKKNDPDWLAHRSENSWSGMLTLPAVDGTMAENRWTNWFFAAASGATTYHLKNRQSKTTSTNLFNKETHYIAPQLNIFDELGGRTADYVTFTLGGNDADFAEIIITAATSNSDDLTVSEQDRLQNKIDSVWAEFWEEGGIRDSLKQAYKDIEAKAGKQAHIIVAGYPLLLNPAGADLFFSAKEANIINTATHEFNNEIRKLVDECKASGMKIHFASVEEAFQGHEAYTDDPYITPIYLGRKSQDLEWIQAASSYSVHPNINGARAYARCVQAKIDEIEAAKHPRETSGKLDAVLVLDASGSMAGTPIKETKKAADSFIAALLNNDAGIGVVAYGRNAAMVSDFTKNGAYLSRVINDLETGGARNTEAGFRMAEEMLAGSNAGKRVILLICSNVPNVGLTGDYLEEYAKSLRAKGLIIYTLGLFAGSSGVSGLRELLESVADTGCHYQADKTDELGSCLDDIARSLTGEKYIYVRLTGPADICVSCNGETLSSGAADGTAVLRLKENDVYDISITGTGDGTIDYSVGFIDDNGRYSDYRVFSDIPVTPGTVFNAVIDRETSSALNTVAQNDDNNDADDNGSDNETDEDNGAGDNNDNEFGSEEAKTQNEGNSKQNGLAIVAIVLSYLIAAAAALFIPFLIASYRGKKSGN